jgi:hypothetical protein
MLVEAANWVSGVEEEEPPSGAFGARDGALHRRLAT